MFDTENFKFSPLFAEIFGHDLGIQEFPTTTATAATKPASLPRVFFADGAPTARTDAIRHGLSGFGRRNSLLIIYVAAVVLANPELKDLKLHFSIYEMQKETEEGSGYSCQTTCDGALNTGIPGQVAIPAAAVSGLPADIKDLTNLAQAITAELQKNTVNITAHETELGNENLAARMLFSEAIKGGEIDTKEAFTTRGDVGKRQWPKIQKALTYIENNMNITIERRFEQEVVGVVVTNPQKPKLLVRKAGTNDAPTPVEFDFVHLANGTPWALPPGVTPGPAVSSAIPNQNDVKEFLTKSGVLDSQTGLIKSGKRIAITGFSLSAYDYVPLVLRYTSLIEATKTGYNIKAENAKDYQGLLTFVSRDGVPAPPRHINPKHFESPTPILTSEELHALQLQKQFDWLSFWTVFLDANVARSLGKHPKDLHYRQLMTPEKRMVDYARQNEDHKAGKPTEVGLQRTGYWLAYGGQGFYADPAMAEAALVAKAPLTRTDLAPFLLRRGSLAEVTSEEYVLSNSNKPFFDVFTVMHWCVAASPPAIQNLVARMFELGVAKHVAGDFTEVLKTLERDALFAPNLLDRRNDAALVSLKGAVKEVVPGQPEYTKGRFLRTHDGAALVHAVDAGMGGQGTRVTRLSGQSIVGMRWSDTSFLDAAAYDTASAASMTVLLSSIAAKGYTKPAERLVEYYRGTLPTPEEFDTEIRTAKFESVWREVHEKHAFLVLCEEAAEDAAKYLEYTNHVFDSKSREEFVVGLKRHGPATDKYNKAIAGIPAFAPPSMEKYYERFVDLSPSDIQKCWAAHKKV